ncbi:class I SAM-dependent methyltransferase [soil metagenome]
MNDEFDRDYWEQHWTDGSGTRVEFAGANPHVIRETAGLTPGIALDAGCGAGSEAIWLASQGWRVTGVDISATALAEAAERAAQVETPLPITWIEADLTDWRPDAEVDLVVTNYAHPATSQLDFYRRLAGFVAPGGTLLIVGHLKHEHAAGHEGAPGSEHDHGHENEMEHPESSQVSLADITATFDSSEWVIETADEVSRKVGTHDGGTRQLHDVVVRALRVNDSA